MIKKIATVLIAITVLTATASAAPAQEKEILKDLKNYNGKVGVFAKNLRTGKTIEFNENVIFPTASTSKLIVASATYKYLYPKAGPSKKREYDKAVEAMITVSDNTTFAELLAEIDRTNPNALNKVCRDVGLHNTRIHNDGAHKKYKYHSITTPYEMSKMLENIYSEKYLNKEKSKLLKHELANTIFHDEIPRYMNTTVYHKVGELDRILCDVGIVMDGNDPILISFYTDSADHVYASKFIATESKKIYNALRRR
ncbi:MAG: hypothetical protein H6Q73_3000 [Firmicutes bacterium]|nr:hypothetical protein [Bacillota bacterium]